MHEDVMGKIYDFKTKKLIADLPKYDFLEVPEEIVNGDRPLTKEVIAIKIIFISDKDFEREEEYA
jgi:hypothetical protein